MGGGRWKSQNRKNVYLSPYVEELLNPKVIKSFVPELKSRKCFSCFEIPMFYIYIYIYIYTNIMNVLHTGMNMSISRIRIWLWYKERPSKLSYYQDRPEYWEESWRPEETYCHTNSNGRPSANAGVKNFQRRLDISASGDHPNYCIIVIGQNTEKSPRDLRRLVVTQIPVRNHPLTLVGKTLKREQIILIN